MDSTGDKKPSKQWMALCSTERFLTLAPFNSMRTLTFGRLNLLHVDLLQASLPLLCLVQKKRKNTTWEVLCSAVNYGHSTYGSKVRIPIGRALTAMPWPLSICHTKLDRSLALCCLYLLTSRFQPVLTQKCSSMWKMFFLFCIIYSWPRIRRTWATQ